jgi:lipopolysaccharide export system permease protein
MKKIDWYILKKLLKTFVFVVVIIVAVICVIDWSEKNEDFIRSEASISQILFKYYLNLIPYWANILGPLMAFIASVFVSARLAGHTEFIAMLSGGISYRRLMVPYLMASTIIGSVVFFAIGWIIPKANKERLEFEFAYLKNPYYFNDRNIHFKLGQETYAYLESYNNHDEIGFKFTIEKFDDRRLVSKLSSPRIQWIDSNQVWRLNHYTLHNFYDSGEYLEEGRNLDTTLNLYPKDFENKERLYETFTLPELDNFIEEMKARGSDNVLPYLVERYERYTYPFAIIILTLMGFFTASRKSRRGMGFQIAIGFILAFVYIFFVMMSRSLAQVGGMSPLLSAMFPTLIFSAVTIFLYKTAPK